MTEPLVQLFKQSNELAVPEGLGERVLARIAIVARAKDRFDRYAWGAFFVVSLSGFVASGVYAAERFSTSGFGSYLSLLFSDIGSFANIWKDLGLSLVESLPVLGIGIFLASVWALLWSARKFSKHTGRFITRSQAVIA